MDKFRTPERMKAYEERMEKRYKQQEAMDKIAKLDEELGLNPGQDALDYFSNLKYNPNETRGSE
jgi:predicted solute-binding protein